MWHRLKLAAEALADGREIAFCVGLGFENKETGLPNQLMTTMTFLTWH